MILTDTGPLVAMIDGGDPDHAACTAAAAQMDPPMLTTLAVVTEAMHLLHRIGGWQAQQSLWNVALRGDLILAELDQELLSRCHALMSKYQDTPMDLADATLVALAERRKIKRIFTLDSHFGVYRLHDRTAFQIVP